MTKIIDLRAAKRHAEEQKQIESEREFIRRKLAAVSAFERAAAWQREEPSATQYSHASGAGFFARQFFITIAGLAMLFLVANAGSLQPSAAPASTFHTLGEIASKSDSTDTFSRSFHSLEAISRDQLGYATSTADFIFAPTATTSTTFWSVDTGGANVTISLDTSTSSPPYSGIGSVKSAVASAVGNNQRAIIAYNPQGVWNISQFTNVVLYFRTDSTAMASYFVQLVDNQATVASSTYTFTPTVANQWEKIILPIASPSSTNGTLDKTKIDKILVGITEPASAVAMNFWVEAPGVSGGSGLATIESVRRDTMNIGTPQDATTTPAAASSLFSALKFISGNTNASSTVFTASGTWTRPSGTNHVWVTMCGGGGGGGTGGSSLGITGGGGGGAGGGGGGQLYFHYPVTVNGNITVTVGGAGSNSSFGSLLTATAGSAGSNGGGGGANIGGGGGGGGNGNPAGMSGANGFDDNNNTTSASGGAGGAGGSIFFGIAGGGGTGGTSGAGGGAGGAASGFCAGGGGGGGSSSVSGGVAGGSGGNGAPGIVVVEWFE